MSKARLLDFEIHSREGSGARQLNANKIVEMMNTNIIEDHVVDSGSKRG
jgi:hypothetical protein